MGKLGDSAAVVIGQRQGGRRRWLGGGNGEGKRENERGTFFRLLSIFVFNS